MNLVGNLKPREEDPDPDPLIFGPPDANINQNKQIQAELIVHNIEFYAYLSKI